MNNPKIIQTIKGNPHQIVFVGFFIYAFSLGAMFPRLDDIQTSLEIDKAELGLLLLCIPLGLQVTLLFADRLVRAISLKNVICLGIPSICFTQFAAVAVNQIAFFAFFLIICGAFVAVVEVAINLEADRVEHALGSRIMNRSHAFWSIGFFSAAVVGALFSQFKVMLEIHFLLVCGIAFLISKIIFEDYIVASPRHTNVTKIKKFSLPTGPILVMVLFTMSAMLVEGASIDWSVIFMREIHSASPFISGFSLAMAAFSQALVRFFGDNLLNKFGPILISVASLFFMFLGIFSVVLSNSSILAILGFLFMGAGSAVIFPMAISIAASRSDRPAETNVASLTQFAFGMFLLGPPILGFVGEAYSLRWSFSLCIPLLILSCLMLLIMIKKEPYFSN
ncbi:MAG: MFS transporter [Rhodobacterales bacterium]|nr:MFS transporter [Rhodobacterales bacterium]